MEPNEILYLVKALTDETDTSVISAFVLLAGKKLCAYGDPFHTMTEEAYLATIPEVVVDAAAYMINKRGWDYQVAYTENGVRREYEAGDLPKSILDRITPIGKVMG